jgi:hypothetical protein
MVSRSRFLFKKIDDVRFVLKIRWHTNILLNYHTKFFNEHKETILVDYYTRIKEIRT